MSERTYKLLDGSELICSEEGILSHRLEPDFTEITTDPNAEYMNLLALVDSLQQQLAERDRTIELLTKDQALKPKKWTVVNTVYFNDDSNQIYGYKVKNEDNTMRRIISSKTANELTLKGELIFSPRQELSFVSVDRDYIEKALSRE
ncbi:hypothetical protein C1I59_13555 [Paenibacillus polymyxa]|uniref:hypothetical protein n=1 Tax=Paenibacillus polymyxa TaxID=1406 RepID=UPI0010BF398E|nr:hypothetical protein [Paenibacillus polymyxa]TKH35975.1 hypothetical protein C1I59_13555 [Paenibacillus polymyxa]